jgi:hypothetical protein
VPDAWLQLVEYLELDLTIIELLEVGQLDLLEGALQPLDNARLGPWVQELLFRETE